MRRMAARERPARSEISTMLRPSSRPSKLSITRSPRASERTKSGLPAYLARSLAGSLPAARARFEGFNGREPCVRLSHILYKDAHSRNNAPNRCESGGAAGRMAEWMSLAEAIGAHVRDGDTVAMEGFTHLIPFAAGHEIIRQKRRNLSLIRMTPDLIYDQLIGVGCAAKLTFSWGGNPGVGSLHRFRDAVENGWPQSLEIEERSHSDLANAYVAGAANLPFAVFRGYTGSDFARVNERIRSVTCPFTGEVLAATPSVRPDVTVIHAQKADWKGNVLLWGILGVQKEAVLAAKRAVVTVEERVRTLDAAPNACILPNWVVSAVCEVPRGATPSYAHGYYERDNVFYRTWDGISRDRERFNAWIERQILETDNFAEYLKLRSSPDAEAVR